MVNFNLSRKTSTCTYTYNARIVNPSLGYRDVQNKSRSLMYIDQHKKQKYIWLRGMDTCTDKDGGRGSGPHLENSNFIKLTQLHVLHLYALDSSVKQIFIKLPSQLISIQCLAVKTKLTSTMTSFCNSGEPWLTIQVTSQFRQDDDISAQVLQPMQGGRHSSSVQTTLFFCRTNPTMIIKKGGGVCSGSIIGG